MARLLALAVLLAAAGGAGAKQADARAQALQVPHHAGAAKRPGVPGVSSAMDARALRLSFDAAALDLAPAFAADDVSKGARASTADKLDAAEPPALDLPLPKARPGCVSSTDVISPGR